VLQVGRHEFDGLDRLQAGQRVAFQGFRKHGVWFLSFNFGQETALPHLLNLSTLRFVFAGGRLFRRGTQNCSFGHFLWGRRSVLDKMFEEDYVGRVEQVEHLPILPHFSPESMQS